MANDGISIELPQSELNKLGRLMKEMERATGAESQKVVRNTARDFCRIAIRMTPRGKSRKKWFVAKNKEGKPFYIYKGKQTSFGLAKSGWSGCLNRLGVARKGRANAESQWGERNGSEVEKDQAPKYFALTTTNKIPFIEDFDNGNYPKGKPKHILERSLRKLNIDMERKLSRMAQRILKKGLFG